MVCCRFFMKNHRFFTKSRCRPLFSQRRRLTGFSQTRIFSKLWILTNRHPFDIFKPPDPLFDLPQDATVTMSRILFSSLSYEDNFFWPSWFSKIKNFETKSFRTMQHWWTIKEGVRGWTHKISFPKVNFQFWKILFENSSCGFWVHEI